TYTVGDEGGQYSTTWSLVLDGRWLEQTYDQPEQPRARAFKAQYLVGFDERRGEWVRFGAMTTGQYFAIRMTETATGWGWKYVSFFKRTRPESSGYDAVFSRKSDSLYLVDGPTYPNGNGTIVTEHHTCAKAG
ncbi:MAG TPA: hypothetical protein VEW74_08465, partial [Candidatus Nitrosotalea sp.]|nr:hypothetical protein [Candidatus Nitrosotalea sp.]